MLMASMKLLSTFMNTAMRCSNDGVHHWCLFTQPGKLALFIDSFVRRYIYEVLGGSRAPDFAAIGAVARILHG